MPVHDWTRVDAGIFHAFHQQWMIALSNALNGGILPGDYYALPEQFAAGFGPDVLTLQGSGDNDVDDGEDSGTSTGRPALLLAEPKLAPIAETDLEFYRRRQTPIVVRHVSGDRVVAVVEIVSPGNKSTRHAMRGFVEKAATLLERGVHLLVIDLLPPGPRDPHGIHAAVWEEIDGREEPTPPEPGPVTLASYESGLRVRAFVRTAATGEQLPEIPLFLEPNGCVHPPLEATYQTAFAFMPRRWRRVLESAQV